MEKFICSVRVLFAGFALFVASMFPARSASQVMIDLKPVPALHTNRVVRKLAPELRLAAASSATFLGITTNGQPVLRYNEAVSISSQRTVLQKFASVTRVNEEFDKPYDRIDEILVLLKSLPSAEVKTLAGLPISDRHEAGRFVTVRSPAGFTGGQINALATDPSVNFLEPNYRFRLAQDDALPNDPSFADGSQWGLEKIHATAAWTATHGGSTIVAVLDTGVDYTHEDLAGNMWRNPGEIPGNRLDDDGNGYVDDVFGYDFVLNSGDPMDHRGHGTHCAGIIGAMANNGKGIAGLNWKVKIMALKIFDATGATKVDWAVKAIDYAIAQHASVLNLSWGGPETEGSIALHDALQRAADKGILIVAAACNNHSDNDAVPFYPACYSNPNLISVLAIDTNDTLCGFSNFGRKSVQIGAPGRQIFSTVPGNTYQFKDGTSMAAPFVSGALALVWSHPSYFSAPGARIREVVLTNARPVTALANKCVNGHVLDLAFLGNKTPPSAVQNTPGNNGVKPGVGTGAMPVPGGGLAPVEVSTIGVIEAPIFAIGGETTGIRLKTLLPNSAATSTNYDIIVNDARLKSEMNKLSGKKVAIKGWLSVTNGPELGERQVLHVTELKVLPQ